MDLETLVWEGRRNYKNRYGSPTGTNGSRSDQQTDTEDDQRLSLGCCFNYKLRQIYIGRRR